MNVYAHRGFSGEYPENTMLAFRKAVEAGCDGIELDVQLSKDGIPVIMHDEKVDRTSDGTGAICNLTYDELTKFNCSYPKKFGNQFGFEKIPSLEEYLSWMAQEAVSIVTNIELKNSIYYYSGMEEQVIALIRKYHLEDRMILSSFNHASILLCKQKEPRISCGFLAERSLDPAGVYARACGVEYYHPGLECLTEEQVRNCSQNGICVNVWTVNEKEEIARMKAWGVHAVITNFPDRGREVEDKK